MAVDGGRAQTDGATAAAATRAPRRAPRAPPTFAVGAARTDRDARRTTAGSGGPRLRRRALQRLRVTSPLAENLCMSDQNPYDIAISVATRFVDEQSRPADNRYVFAYTITIQNTGEIGAQLLSRHWIITDGNGKVEEVRGDGVVGEQPHMRPGEEFQYTSGAVLETSVGIMRGSYRLIAEDGTVFDAPIPQFTLSVPRTLH